MRGHKSDLVLLDEAKEFRPCYGSSPLLRIMKDVLFFQKMEDFNREYWASQVRPPWPEENTSEQVTPAAVKGPGDVEQQAQEEVVQLPAPISR